LVGIMVGIACGEEWMGGGLGEYGGFVSGNKTNIQGNSYPAIQIAYCIVVRESQLSTATLH
jgi:hypothetical protein